MARRRRRGAGRPGRPAAHPPPPGRVWPGGGVLGPDPHAPRAAPGWLGPEEWLLVQDADAPGDRSYWLISLPAETPLSDLVRHAKGRWRVEQDYRDLKQEIGLGHFEGRSWRGLNHHVTLCLAAYGFLVRERSLFPPRPPNSPQTSTPVRPA